MKIAVLKFGGTSLSTKEGKECAFKHIKRALKDGFYIVIVVSAMGRDGDPYSTDTLLSLVSGEHLSKSDLDQLMSCGEVISAITLSSFLNSKGLSTTPLSGKKCGIITDDNYGESSIIRVDNEAILKTIDQGKIPVITGFQGVTEEGDITTIGRGGSDITAMALAASLGAELVEIYKDVNGAMTKDPKTSSDAEIIKQISAQELLSMANSGSRLMHHKAIAIAIESQITFHIRNNFSDNPGTIVYPNPEHIFSQASQSHRGR